MSEIFDLVDLNSDGLLDRNEFNWFQMMLSDEDIDDESWQVVLGKSGCVLYIMRGVITSCLKTL